MAVRLTFACTVVPSWCRSAACPSCAHIRNVKAADSCVAIISPMLMTQFLKISHLGGILMGGLEPCGTAPAEGMGGLVLGVGEGRLVGWDVSLACTPLLTYHFAFTTTSILHIHFPGRLSIAERAGPVLVSHMCGASST